MFSSQSGVGISPVDGFLHHNVDFIIILLNVIILHFVEIQVSYFSFFKFLGTPQYANGT